MKFRLFGGKGGVGKTTCAAATALAAAEAGAKILVVSTDPAHSLGDALGSRLGPDPVRIPTKKGELLAVELSAERSLSRFLAEHRRDLAAIADRGTYLDTADVDRLLGLDLPGADELAALLALPRLARETGCDEVVVDTAPTAHTLRLLALPESLRRFAETLDRLQGRHRWMAERFGGTYRPDETDAFVAEIEAEGRDLEAMLRDPERSELVWVMLPEALSVAESRDAVAALAAEGIRVREIVVNRVVGDVGECPVCRARWAEQAAAMGEIEEAFAGIAVRVIEEEREEPRGRGRLRRVFPRPGPHPLAPSPIAPPSPGRGGTRDRKVSLAWLDEIAPPGLRLLLFGGKGGVGKTTCAAAVALALAERRPEQKILLLSTDPAHSVGDVLEIPLGDDERPVASGLVARELDAPRVFAEWRERHGEAVGGALESFAVDGTSVRDLIDLVPPGLDELVAVSTLLDAVSGDELVVVDTAPTGHALRLLEMPRVALAWDHALLSILLKYREAVGLGELAEELVALSRSLKGLQALLRDPARTGFVAVTRAAELPRRETVRLLQALRRLSIAVPAVVVNAVPPPGCERCGGGEIPVERYARLAGEGCA
ncbi:MAG TPA: ArsA family ATPase, partial [Thermoanaerobaculia bacterium]|nr:ArsA family ATPase [Thermoanaerobaculia bacterium]